MPYVEASSLADIPKKDRARFQKLLYNKAVLGYAFSYDRLHKLISHLTDDEEEINEMIDSCVEGHNTKEIDAAKAQLNEAISAVLSSNGISSLEAPDPFGRVKHFILMPTSNSSFKRDLAVQCCSKYKVSPETMIRIIEEATVRKEYVVLQCRDAESKNKEEDQ